MGGEDSRWEDMRMGGGGGGSDVIWLVLKLGGGDGMGWDGRWGAIPIGREQCRERGQKWGPNGPKSPCYRAPTGLKALVIRLECSVQVLRTPPSWYRSDSYVADREV